VKIQNPLPPDLEAFPSMRCEPAATREALLFAYSAALLERVSLDKERDADAAVLAERA
jgi:hypothetical protein